MNSSIPCTNVPPPIILINADTISNTHHTFSSNCAPTEFAIPDTLSSILSSLPDAQSSLCRPPSL